MADDPNEPAVIDTRDTDKLLRRIDALAEERYKLRAKVQELEQYTTGAKERIAALEKEAKEAAKVATERDALVAERAGWADERAILGSGVVDDEGVSFVRLAWSQVPEDKRPEGGLSEWLKGEELPRGVRAYLPQPAEQANQATGRRPPPDPSTGARGIPAAAHHPDRVPGGSRPSDYRTQRDSVWASMGIGAPRLPGSKDT